LNRYHKRQDGFTLIEILIALFITAILCTMIGVFLHTVVRTQSHLKKIDSGLMRLQVANVLWMRDVSQIINRPIRTNKGVESAVLSYSDGTVAMTTIGLVNPNFSAKRGRLLRVAYGLKNHQWLRVSWSSLDRNNSSVTVTSKPLLNHVEAMRVQYLNPEGQWVSTWPPRSSTTIMQQQVASTKKKKAKNSRQSSSSGQATQAASNRKPDPMPKAIMVTLTTKAWGIVKWMVNLPGASRVDLPAATTN
jgi:general secretion pathway protein J